MIPHVFHHLIREHEVERMFCEWDPVIRWVDQVQLLAGALKLDIAADGLESSPAVLRDHVAGPTSKIQDRCGGGAPCSRVRPRCPDEVGNAVQRRHLSFGGVLRATCAPLEARLLPFFPMLQLPGGRSVYLRGSLERAADILADRAFLEAFSHARLAVG